MFGRKKEKPRQTPFQLQVLTADYLIEGTAEADQQLYIPTSEDDWSPILLTDVRITSVREDKIPVRRADTFEVQGGAVVAVIPLKDASTMEQYDVYIEYEEEMKGTFYLGPYIIEGTLLNVGDDLTAPALLIEEAEVRLANPNVKFAPIKANDILVNTFWLHGREVK